MDSLRSRIKAIFIRFIPSGDLTERTVKSGVWVAGLNVIDRALKLTMTLLVAGLIGPTEFGLMSLALLTLGAFSKLSQLGIDTALIQRTERNIDGYLNTTWTLQIIRGLLLASILYSIAPIAAEFFGEQNVTPVLRVIALIPLVKSVQNPGIVYLQKNLEFHRQFAYVTSGTAVSVVVSVGYAIVSPTVWALVFGLLSEALTRLGGSFLFHPYRPKPTFDRETARKLLDYGKWIFASRALAFLGGEGDDAVVGWLLGTGPLGLYQLGFRLSNAPATEITHTISNVVFPAYSKIQKEPAALRRGYFDTLRLISFISIPMAIGIIIVTPPFVALILGPAWEDMVVPMQILAAFGLFRSIRSAAMPLFRATGRPHLETRIRAVKLFLLVLAIYPATIEYGLVGTASVVLGQSLIGSALALGYSVRTVEGQPTELLQLLSYPAMGSLFMGAVTVLVQSRLPSEEPALVLLIAIPTGIIAYISIMWVFERQFGYKITRIVSTIQESI